MSSAAGIWYYAASLAQHAYGDAHNDLGPNYLAVTVKEPIGVVGVITPWNFPLLIVSQKLPFALAVGCTAVVKPSDLTPGTTTAGPDLARRRVPMAPSTWSMAAVMSAAGCRVIPAPT